MAAVLGAACDADDDDDAGAATPVARDAGAVVTAEAAGPATTCAAGDADSGRTVTVRVDDLVGGFGSLGSQTPSGLTAGPVRIAVDADYENEGPVEVVVTGPDGAAATVTGVEAGATCAVDVELAVGDYVVTSSANPGADSTFTVVP